MWAGLAGKPWREFGFVRPRNWVKTVAIGIATGIALKVVMKAIVMPLFGADPVNHAYHVLAGNRAALPSIVLAVTVGGGIGEEIVFRGFLFERLTRLLGHGARTRAVIVLLTAAGFGMLHYQDQGVAGAEQATITGLVFGGIFALTGVIWVPIFAHAAFDLAAVAMIYYNLESYFAHIVFK